MQIYKGMDIGTAKPSREEQEICKHHLIDLVYPDEGFDANRYRQMALAKIDELEKKELSFVFAGGTGLYMDVLRYGLFEGAPKDPELRQRLEKLEHENPGYLYEQLCKLDPESASKIHPNDMKRKTRALEVFLITGQRFSELGKKRVADERFELIFLNPERQKLYEDINLRVDKMIENGLIEETKSIVEKYGTQIQSMKAIGYAETIDYLKGKFTSFEDYRQTLKKNTRHYAKRQIIWSRRYPDAKHLNIKDIGEQELLKKLEKTLE